MSQEVTAPIGSAAIVGLNISILEVTITRLAYTDASKFPFVRKQDISKAPEVILLLNEVKRQFDRDPVIRLVFFRE